MSNILKKVKKDDIKNCLPTILIAICVFCDLWVLKDIKNYANSIILVILIPILYLFYKNTFYINQEKFSKIYTVLPSILISLFLMLGEGIEKYGSFTFLFNGIKQSINTFILFVGYFSFLYGVINLLFNKIALVNKSSSISAFQKNKILSLSFYKHPFWSSFIIIFILWLPYLIASYPGRFMGDTYYQLYQFFGVKSFSALEGEILLDPNMCITQHHPVVHTVFLGFCVKLGRMLNSCTLGLFIYTVTQYTTLAFSFAVSFWYLVKKKVPDYFKLLTILFLSLFPLLPMIATLTAKDGFFSAFILLYVICCIQIIDKPESIFNYPTRIVVFFIIVLLCCLSKKNGIYVILLSFPIIIFFYIQNHKLRNNLLAVFLCSLTVLFLYSSILLPILKISKGSIRETLSLPFQQTARYVRYHSDDVTEDEMEAISNILNYDELASRYDENISDPVKCTFNSYSTKKDLAKYFKVWFEMFFKHPLTYIDATVNSTYGYIYSSSNYRPYIYPLSQGYPDMHDNGFNMNKFEFNKDLSVKLDKCISKLYDIPVLSLFFALGFYPYILTIASSIILYKNRKFFIAFVPAYVLLLTCIFSPVNGNVYSRYMWPIIFILPLLVGTCFMEKKKS